MTIEETDKSSDLGLKHLEPCTLQITSSTVILILESSAPVSWPFNCIRRYKCHQGSFLLEVGRKAPTGEGVFRFFTKEGQDIFEHLGKTVANRMSSKQEQSKSDLFSSFANMSTTQSSESQNFLPSSGLSGKQNPFIDLVTSSNGVANEDVRFVMKRRTSLSPPLLPTPNPIMPPQTDEGSYSHLKFRNEKTGDEVDECDYNRLARPKEFGGANHTRLPEIRPKPSSNKALKLLGLIRSNSAEDTNGQENKCDLYSHLDREKRKLKKSHSASDILEGDDEGDDDYTLKQKSADEINPNGDDVYDRLNSKMRKKITVEETCNEVNGITTVSEHSDSPDLEDNTYDKLGASKVHASHRNARPEPIIITDDTYDALDFAFDKCITEPTSKVGDQSSDKLNTYEEPVRPQRFSKEHISNNKSHVNEIRPPLPAPFARPPIAKKPVPMKSPRKQKPDNGSVSSDGAYESTYEVSQNQGKRSGLRENLISQLKKNFEAQDQGNSSSSPLSPPISAKKVVEPLYAVSSFGGGKKPSSSVENEYDVPAVNSQKPGKTDGKQQIGFLYAVSPFHSGNQTEVSRLEHNLYDIPKSVSGTSQHGVSYVNTYDVPVQRPVGNAVENAVENVYDTPHQLHIVKTSSLQGKERIHTPDSNAQFTYAVSPFADAKGNANQIRFRENDCAEVERNPEEAAYCEVPEKFVAYRSVDGYDPVGGILSSGRPGNEPLYENPRE